MSERGKIKKIKGDRIFSGDYSRNMWEQINNAKTFSDVRLTMYTICCRLQELETLLNKGYYNHKAEEESQ